jgi:hypothetical protein
LGVQFPPGLPEREALFLMSMALEELDDFK